MENEPKDIKSQAEILKTQANELLNQAKQLEKSIVEKFDWKKFLNSFNILNPVLWSKWLCGAVRTVIVVVVVVGILFGLGYFKGIQKGVSKTPIRIDIGWGKEAMINLGNGEYMHIDKKGNVHIQDNIDDAKVRKTRILTVADIDGLKAKLNPIGFELSPIGIIGYGTGTNGESGIEAGAGVRFFRFYKTNLDAFITQNGGYLGCSYRLEGIGFKNTSIGLAGGHGWTKDDIRVMVYGSIKF